MSTNIYTEPKKSQQIKPKKHLNKRAKINAIKSEENLNAIKSEENLVDEYLHKSESESFDHLLVRFIYGFIVPL
ncbi:MAG: hypothetical protein F6K17_14540 [Okeania sp. SIO3C4]|nr:hypothetical protein [Okeania sp. SIO3B3]NER03746.1 hypothetical protein [Okeania sp. SIO3C4]